MPTTVEVKAYTYQELSATAKDAARQEWSAEVWGEYCVEGMKDDARYFLGTLTSWELTYSIGFCQGDGVSFKGNIDATDIPDPEWIKSVLPLLGAFRVKAKAGKHDVSWPRPIKDLRIRFEHNGRTEHIFCDGDIVIDLDYLNEEDQPWPPDSYDEETELWEGSHDFAPEIYEAVVGYFRTLSGKLYQTCTDNMLSDEEPFEEECDERGTLFEEDGTFIKHNNE